MRLKMVVDGGAHDEDIEGHVHRLVAQRRMPVVILMLVMPVMLVMIVMVVMVVMRVVAAVAVVVVVEKILLMMWMRTAVRVKKYIHMPLWRKRGSDG